ncbi:MAG: hypothetical protein JXD21_00560 [Candidatus Omnitrophica bacterium]|nr:hypothetical protein [Candidatus Omnitrophota bacterium]
MKKHFTSSAVLFFATVLVFSLNTYIFLHSYFNAFDDTHWDIAKDHLAYPVMGTYSFKYLHYLVDDNLALNKFYGFNQIECKIPEDEQLRFTRVNFDVYLGSPQSYVYFLFKKNEQGSFAFRLGSSLSRNVSFIRFSPFMENIKKIDAAHSPLEVGRWYAVSVVLREGQFELYIDGQPAGVIAEPSVELGRIGFRSGLHSVVIDNVEIIGRYAGSESKEFVVFHDDFQGPLPVPIVFLYSVLISFGIHVLFLSLAIYIGGKSPEDRMAEAVQEIVRPLLRVLLCAGSTLLLVNYLWPSLRFTVFSLFYFGTVWIPSLWFFSLYCLVFVTAYVYGSRYKSLVRQGDFSPRNILYMVLFLSCVFLFIYNGTSLNIFKRYRPNPGSSRSESYRGPIQLVWPKRIELPAEGYHFSSLCMLDGYSKLLVGMGNNKFILSADPDVPSGFEEIAPYFGAYNDFSFNYTSPRTIYPLQKGTRYRLDIFKSGGMLEAKIDGIVVDRKRYDEEEKEDGPFYLFPVAGTPRLSDISVRQLPEGIHILDWVKTKKIISSVFVLGIILFLTMLFAVSIAPRYRTKEGQFSFYGVFLFFSLLFPFFILSIVFRDILCNDKFFYFMLYCACLAIIVFFLVRAHRIRNGIFILAATILILAIGREPVSDLPLDLQPTVFSYFRLKKDISELCRPPQGLAAFLRNNDFGEGYDEEIKGKDIVLLLGSSQTWGAGAVDRAHTIAAYVEEYLNQSARGKNIKVINCGINGANSLFLGNFFNNFLYKYNPKVIVLNLSNNDYYFWLNARETYKKQSFPWYRRMVYRIGARLRLTGVHGADSRPDKETIREKFRQTLIEKFILPCQQRGIDIVFVKEPNSQEADIKHAAIMHVVLEGLAHRYRVPLLSPQAGLDQQDVDNPLWWDFMHLTSFGQKLFAQQISKIIVKNRLLE